MKAMLHIWGDGEFDEYGPIKNTPAYRSLLKKIDNGTWSRDDYENIWPTGSTEAAFGIDPCSAIVTVAEWKNRKKMGEKLFETELDELPEKCFSHLFESMNWIGKRIWHFQQTIHAIWLWQQIDIPDGEEFDPKKLHIDVIHCYFGDEEVYSTVGPHSYYGDKETSIVREFDPTEDINWGKYCELRVFKRK